MRPREPRRGMRARADSPRQRSSNRSFRYPDKINTRDMSFTAEPAQGVKVTDVTRAARSAEIPRRRIEN
ncbi:MAG: hypothetical protein JWP44_4168 [Mucilaginibacter sp.]|nr:hypothetical protein [Mucilaginibacter sp.]